ncbi:MAG: putative lipid II flippase FtsW [Gammaproteobacteria bacterium]|nr:MAG: putative lipid II flippase FtsW [Gammaproteobacteria bacterium]
MTFQVSTIGEFVRGSGLSNSNQNQLLFDKILLGVVVMLIAIGMIMVTSSSMYYAQNTFNGHSFYFINRHIIYLVISFFFAVLVLTQPVIRWQKFGPYLLVAGIILLVVVLFAGKSVNGSRRWLGIGPLTFQVSEVVKLFVIVYLAGYLVRRTDEIQNQFAGFFKPLMVLALISALLLKEPDFGATVVILSTSMAMLFLGGAKLWQFLGLGVVVSATLVGLVFSADYRIKRILVFLDPWKDPFGDGYQLTQSLIAYGRGNIFGEGLGNSLQKLSYLPEAHTDFIFAVLAEEQGLIGVFIVLLLFFILFYRSMNIGRTALMQQRSYSAYLAYGIGFWLTFQALINIGVTSGALPTKGLTLPFVSYGGNSLLICSIAIALLLRIDYENRLVANNLINAEDTEIKYLSESSDKKIIKVKKRKS